MKELKMNEFEMDDTNGWKGNDCKELNKNKIKIWRVYL